jgi:hypothetical protein
MIDEKDLRKLSDYVLLNACSVGSTGLYNGKSGMSLSLFHVARYLNDEEMEEQAFDLLQESLLTKNEDISFENGLAGVGYTLLYLIKNEYIDADFEELFGEQAQTILCKMKDRIFDSSFLLQHTTVIYFLNLLQKFRPNTELNELMDRLLEEMERYLAIQLFHIDQLFSHVNQSTTVSKMRMYLCLSEETGSQVSPSLIDAYSRWFLKGRIASSYEVGFFLKRISLTENPKKVAEANKQFALSNLRFSFLTLRECLNLLSLLKQDNLYWKEYGILLEQELLNHGHKGLEASLCSVCPPDTYQAGYGYGIARFLSYVTGNNTLV